MAELVHYVKQDLTARTSTATTAEESTDYTITWANLTGAGFAAGDDVMVLVGVKMRNSNANNSTKFQVGLGTTYAGRADETDSLMVQETAQTSAGGHQYFWMDRRTLVTSENIYFSKWVETGTGTYETFFCLVLKLGGLSTNDWAYAETTPSGDASVTYTGGASITTPVSGDWLVFAFTHWLIDLANEGLFTRINVNAGTTVGETQSDSENSADEQVLGTITYQASLGASVSVQVEYRVETAATHDCNSTKVFALRLNAFQDHDGVRSTNTITHSVLDTFQEFAGFPTYSKSTTGNVIALAFPFHTTNESTKRPYGQVQLSNADWDAANRNRAAAFDNGLAARIGPLMWAYGSVTAGTLDWDFDIAEDTDVTPSYNCVEQVAAVFSLELASVTPEVGVYPPPFQHAPNVLLRM